MQGRCPVREQFVHIWSTAASGCVGVHFMVDLDLDLDLDLDVPKSEIVCGVFE
jgi:hypothetical protein